MFGVEPLTPAYGRDYKSKREAQADFDADKDFMCASGQYTNRADLAQMYPGKKKYRVRYKRLTQVGFVEVGE